MPEMYDYNKPEKSVQNKNEIRYCRSESKVCSRLIFLSVLKNFYIRSNSAIQITCNMYCLYLLRRSNLWFIFTRLSTLWRWGRCHFVLSLAATFPPNVYFVLRNCVCSSFQLLHCWHSEMDAYRVSRAGFHWQIGMRDLNCFSNSILKIWCWVQRKWFCSYLCNKYFDWTEAIYLIPTYRLEFNTHNINYITVQQFIE